MSKSIKLLLTENVDNLGIVGDVVSVRSGYARNFLLPRGKAAQPTPGAVQHLAARRAEVEKEMALIRASHEAVLEKLKGIEMTMMRSANEQGILFGGVSQHDIAEGLRAEGFAIEDRMVRIGTQIKRLDSYTIPIVVESDLRTEIKLWVVSDKPAEELETSKKEEAPAAEEKPRKKSRKSEAKAEEAPKAE